MMAIYAESSFLKHVLANDNAKTMETAIQVGRPWAIERDSFGLVRATVSRGCGVIEEGLVATQSRF